MIVQSDFTKFRSKLIAVSRLPLATCFAS